jgi:hypothetical protein
MAGHLRVQCFSLALLLASLLPTLLLAADGEEEETTAEPGEDDTKSLLSQLTISMVGDVIDERTFVVRDTAKNARTLVRLGNTAPLERGDLEEADHEKKLEAGKAFLSKLLEKQMIWWKAAPDAHQPSSESSDAQVTVADVWLIDGRHVNSMAKKEGHMLHLEQYQEELAKDILTAEAETAKKQSYKDLEEALKESEAAKAKERAARAEAERAAKKAEEDKGEPLGLAGYCGLAVILVIVVGVATNFGRGSQQKKVNLNKKRGFFGKLWLKLKGA